MQFIKKVGVVIYMLMLLSAGAVLVLMALNAVPQASWADAVDVVYQNANSRIAAGCVGAIFIMLGLVAPFRVSKSMRKGRIITFQNPDGEVTVAISAIEDYIRKIADDMPDVKDVRSHVNMNKKGINVTSAVSIHAGANIPEVMERIQLAVKNNVQGMLGIEEPINITMHISKIIGTPPADMSAPEEEEPQQEEPQQVPFR